MNIYIQTVIIGLVVSLIGISKPLEIFPNYNILNQIISLIIYDVIAIVAELEYSTIFFSKYADHSKEIGKILKNGYGKPELFGSVKDFEIVYPSPPKIEDIGIANKHLEKDHPETWKLKEEIF